MDNAITKFAIAFTVVVALVCVGAHAIVHEVNADTTAATQQADTLLKRVDPQKPQAKKQQEWIAVAQYGQQEK
jgi:hypothetical protein